MEDEAKQVLTARGIPVPPCVLARDEESALEMAKKTGFPVVLKIRSPVIVHKSEHGGVCLDLKDEAAVRAAFRKLMGEAAFLDPDASVAVQPMAKKGIEVLIGVTNDSQFGPVIAFGLGGIFTEILKDVSFRMAPIDEFEAEKMINQIKGSRILKGYRGSPPVDMTMLKKIISEVSRLAVEYDEIAEMDLNPVVVYPEGAVVLDARIILKGRGKLENAK